MKSEPSDPRYIVMAFSDGTVIDPRRCSRNILAKSHWTQTEDRFAVCACKNAEAPECESGTAADQPTGRFVGSAVAC